MFIYVYIYYLFGPEPAAHHMAAGQRIGAALGDRDGLLEVIHHNTLITAISCIESGSV